MPTKKPTDFESLFRFYHEIVKPLYSEIQTQNKQAVEMLFEMNAALDHIARHWSYKDSEKKTVESAYSHFKRACLDAFKLKLKEIRDEYDELRKLNLSIVDNGNFEKRMIQAFNEIGEGASKARHEEGDNRSEDVQVKAFDLWVPVYAACIDFHKQFYLHTGIEWAKKKSRQERWRDRWEQLVIGILGGFISGVLATLFYQWAAGR